MDARRASRVVIDPKVRQVGFFTPDAPHSPGRTLPAPPDCTTSQLSDSPTSNSLSPVMIPPPRHPSDNLASRTAVMPVPASANRRHPEDLVPVGSHNPSETLLGSSPMASPSSRIAGEDLEFSEDSSASVLLRRSGSGKLASSCPGVGFHMAAKPAENLQTMPANSVRTLGTNKPAGATGTKNNPKRIPAIYLFPGWCSA